FRCSSYGAGSKAPGTTTRRRRPQELGEAALGSGLGEGLLRLLGTHVQRVIGGHREPARAASSGRHTLRGQRVRDGLPGHPAVPHLAETLADPLVELGVAADPFLSARHDRRERGLRPLGHYLALVLSED